MTVSYATTDGTATAGSDYTSTGGTLSFAPGELTQHVAVQTVDDDGHEDTESFTVQLSNALRRHGGRRCRDRHDHR